jgi:hypothetical protein
MVSAANISAIGRHMQKGGDVRRPIELAHNDQER